MFIGNLAFDLTETELEEFFGPSKVRHKSLRLLVSSKVDAIPEDLNADKIGEDNQGSGR